MNFQFHKTQARPKGIMPITFSPAQASPLPITSHTAAPLPSPQTPARRRFKDSRSLRQDGGEGVTFSSTSCGSGSGPRSSRSRQTSPRRGGGSSRASAQRSVLFLCPRPRSEFGFLQLWKVLGVTGLCWGLGGRGWCGGSYSSRDGRMRHGRVKVS